MLIFRTGYIKIGKTLLITGGTGVDIRIAQCTVFHVLPLSKQFRPDHPVNLPVCTVFTFQADNATRLPGNDGSVFFFDEQM